MAECPVLTTCIFFNDKMSNNPQTADLMKKNFCLGENSFFARYMVLDRLGKESVPADLFPTEMDTAIRLINS